MAVVYRATKADDPSALFALKVIRPELSRNREFVDMFLDEARIASELDHPNIVHVHGLGQDGERLFLAMELLTGQTLTRIYNASIDRHGRVPPRLAAWIAARIASALDHAHSLTGPDGTSRELVHRDVNPANIIITDDGRPKLIDFGLARAADRITATAAGIVKGKLAYLSPEQAEGDQAGPRSDIFALGVTLWELAVGRRLFKHGDNVETLRRVRASEIPDPLKLIDGFPEDLAHVIRRATARDPDERYPNAAELARALDTYVKGSGDPVTESEVAAYVQSLLGGRPSEPPPSLELAAVSERSQAIDDLCGIEAYDVTEGRQTLLQAALVAPAPVSMRPRSAVFEPPATNEDIDHWLERTSHALQTEKNQSALARLYFERAAWSRATGRANREAGWLEQAREADPAFWPAAEQLARVLEAKGKHAEAIECLETTLERLPSDRRRAETLRNIARMVEATGTPGDVRTAWQRALEADPEHPEALRGLEDALARLRPTDARARAMAGHLTRLADHADSAPTDAAWRHVQRADVLVRELGDREAAREALRNALDLDPGIGPVRTVCIDSAARHDDTAQLVLLLDEEARLQPDAGLRTRTELDAALLAWWKLGDAERALALAERASKNAAVPAWIRRLVLELWADALEKSGAWARAVDARIAIAELSTDDSERVAVLEEAAGAARRAGDRKRRIACLEMAYAIDPDDEQRVERIDLGLADMGEHARRAKFALERAERGPTPARRARAALHAGNVLRDLGDTDGARRAYTLGLANAPSDAELVDALADLLRHDDPVPSMARARFDALAEAAEAAEDRDLRIAYLERMAMIAEEALGDAVLAVRVYRDAAELDPHRRAVRLGLARAARAAGDDAALSVAHELEADHASDERQALLLRTRAASTRLASEPDRALAMLESIADQPSAPDEALKLLYRQHVVAERWAAADQVLDAWLERTDDRQRKKNLLVEQAHLRAERMGEIGRALKALGRARTVDQADRGLRRMELRLLIREGDALKVAEALDVEADARDDEHAPAFSYLAGMLRLHVLGEPARAETSFALAADASNHDALATRARNRALSVWLEREPKIAKKHIAELDPTSTVTADIAQFRLSLRAHGPSAALGGVARLALDDNPASPAWVHTAVALARDTGDRELMHKAWRVESKTGGSADVRHGALWRWIDTEPPEDALAVALVELIDESQGDASALGRLIWQRPAAEPASARYVDALSTLAQRASDRMEAYARFIQLGIELATSEEASQSALFAFRGALRAEPDSPLGALNSLTLGQLRKDADAEIAGAEALSRLAFEPPLKSAHLLAAARVLVDRPPTTATNPTERAASLLERALEIDPDASDAASLLAEVQKGKTVAARLLHTLRSAQARAQTAASVFALGHLIADVVDKTDGDSSVSVAAMRRIREVAPKEPKTLGRLAELLIAQSAWPDAEDVLKSLIANAQTDGPRDEAQIVLAQLYEGPLANPKASETQLRGILTRTPNQLTALRMLIRQLNQRWASDLDVRAEIERFLSVLAETEPDTSVRAAAYRELFALRSYLGHADRAEAALIEATFLDPSTEMADRIANFYAVRPDGDAKRRATLSALATRLEAAQVGAPAIFEALGILDVEASRFAEGEAWLVRAKASAPLAPAGCATLARAYAETGSRDRAIEELTSLITDHDRPLLRSGSIETSLELLERLLAQSQRGVHAWIVRELRALGGLLDDGELVQLRARRHPELPRLDQNAPPEELAMACAGAAWMTALSGLGRAIAGASPKAFRTELGELGLSNRDRISPRSHHPLRMAFDATRRLLGLDEVDLAASQHVGGVRIVLADEPWVVVPTSITNWPEPVQLAALARPLMRVALGVEWVESLPPAHVHAVVIALLGLATGDNTYRADSVDVAELVDYYTPRLGRAMGRRQKRALASWASMWAGDRTPSLRDTQNALRDASVAERVFAHVVTGDVLHVIDETAKLDVDLGRAISPAGRHALRAALVHPIIGPVWSVALSAPIAAWRERIGTAWTG